MTTNLNVVGVGGKPGTGAPLAALEVRNVSQKFTIKIKIFNI